MSSILEVLLTKKGQILTVTTMRDMKVRKGQAGIQKKSSFQARAGVTYDNMKAVKEKRADGTLPEENQGLPWGQWKTFPYVIEHKGEDYFRFSTVTTTYRGTSSFYRDGVEISADEAKAACLASEFKASDSSLDVFNVRVNSILEVKG